MPVSKVEVMLFVKFKSELSLEEVVAAAEERKPQFRALPGLLQKYYCLEPSTGEIAGVYLWDSHDSLKSYLASDLRQSIPNAYKIVGAPRIEVLEVLSPLRDS